MDQLSGTAETISIEIPADLHAQLQVSAAKMGLTPAAYLALLEGIQQGKVAPDIVSAVREIFTRDREILRELAK